MCRRWWLLLLPIVLGAIGPASLAGAADVLLGIYPDTGSFDNPASRAEVLEIETWIGTGRRFTFAGEFMTLETSASQVAMKLNGAWNNGFIPFVNFHTNLPRVPAGCDTTSPACTSVPARIVNGDIDAGIDSWAAAFAQWAKSGGGKRAFLAPLPEMNGKWTGYYTANKQEFKDAFLHIKARFDAALAAAGVTHKAINWTFPPNNGGEPGDEFELYYPGPDHVDIVAVSAYNYGGCPPVAPWFIWETFETGFKPYLDRLRAMAPGKPLFLAQTGSLDKPAHGIGNKDEWFRDTFAKFGTYPRLRGIVYFNIPVNGPANNLPNCDPADFRLRVPGTANWQGFKDAMTAPGNPYEYWAPTSPDVANIMFAQAPAQIFGDVAAPHPWAVDPGEQDLSFWIHALFNAGITSGCTVEPPLMFCPKAAVTREQMAVFLLRGMFGAGFSPPPATGTLFADVPLSNGFAAWIERLANGGITSGCALGPPRLYCPGNVVTRAEMAVFLLRAKHGAGYVPPAPTQQTFADVPLNHAFAPWIYQLAAEGVTGGCAVNPSRYCPDAGVTREQMAIFLVRIFGL